MHANHVHVEPNAKNLGMHGSIYMDGSNEIVSDAEKENISEEDGVIFISNSDGE